uniref:Putative ovule protein n=1 Tax=Solanum chacoense TaxID=4108 RepID=A0A0V0GL73_SOLCH
MRASNPARSNTVCNIVVDLPIFFWIIELRYLKLSLLEMTCTSMINHHFHICLMSYVTELAFQVPWPGLAHLVTL